MVMTETMAYESDIHFIRSFCDRVVPISVELDHKGKYTKRPVISKWTSVTPQQSDELVSSDNWRHFMFVVGEEAGLFVVDLDKKDISRPDHDDKIDGIEFFEDWCGPVEAADTFTTRTISGGYHKVYRYTPELAGKLKSGRLTPLALCDILFDGKGFTFGDGYKIINRMSPKTPPKSVINFIVNNNVLNNGIIGNLSQSGQQNQQNQQNLIAGALSASAPISRSDRINCAIGTSSETGIAWKISDYNGSYQIVPDTRECCVEVGHQHTEVGHSCLYVHRSSVVSNCFSHGKRVITGDVSRSIREIFFDMGEEKKGIMVRVIHEIEAAAKEGSLVRENGSVLRRIGNTHAYEHVDSYTDYLRSTLADHIALKERPRRFTDLMIYMDNIDSIDFPFVKRNKRYICFANGILDIVSGELVEENVLNHGEIPRHYIDQQCDLEDVDTPLFDGILMHQLGSDELYTYFLALVGRLLYEVRQFDSFDIIPFIVGDINTGKSTLVDIICAMFSPDSVGVIDSGHEVVFGLQNSYNKELIVASEINDRMAQQLASDKFKKMVCGELVSVPIKHGKAASVRWKVPMFMCGNRYLDYQDDKGSISKRLAIFKFDRLVTEMDDSLKHRIISTELSKVVVKSLSAYRLLLQHAGNRGFWKTCPEYFRDNRDELNQTTDYIHMFLTLGPDENAWSNKVLFFVKVKNACMMLEDFKKKFLYYMRFRHPNVRYKWDQDLSALKRLGYEITNTKICRSCLQEAHKDCCSNYDHANRSTRRVIRHILCVEREIDVYGVA